MSTGKISLVVNTLNEESNIEECLQSATPYVDEIIVCDMYSEDNTVKIAENFGAKVFSFERVGYVEPARKFAISKATNEWVFVLDADERITSKLGKKIIGIAQNGDLNIEVVQFWSLFWYFGDWVRNGGFFFGEWPRFFKKETYLNSYDENELQVHKNFSNLRNSSKKLQLNRNYYIKHYAYETVSEYIYKTVYKYSKIEAENLFNSGTEFSLMKMILSPLKQFVYRYFYKAGFRDGMRGFVLAFLFGVHRFSVWANLWYLIGENEDKD